MTYYNRFISDGIMVAILSTCPHNPEDGTRGFAAKKGKPQGWKKPKC